MFVPPMQTRILVGTTVNLVNKIDYIVAEFKEQLTDLTFKLMQIKLSLQKILFKHKTYWQSAIKYVALSLNLLYNRIILQKFYRSLLLYLNINRIFPIMMITADAAIRG